NEVVHLLIRCWMFDTSESKKYQMMDDFICGIANEVGEIQLNVSPRACGRVAFEIDGVVVDTAFKMRKRTVFIPYHALKAFIGIKDTSIKRQRMDDLEWYANMEVVPFAVDDARYKTDRGPQNKEEILQYLHWPKRPVAKKKEATVLAFPTRRTTDDES